MFAWSKGLTILRVPLTGRGVSRGDIVETIGGGKTGRTGTAQITYVYRGHLFVTSLHNAVIVDSPTHLVRTSF